MANLVELISSDLPSKDDRSFHYGDGCFTTMLRINGRISLLSQHAKRLFEDSYRLALFPQNLMLREHDFEVLLIHIEKEYVAPLCSEMEKYGVVKISISRGIGGRGYAPAENVRPVISISLHNFVMPSNKPIDIAVSKEVQLASQPLLAGIKHKNRLEQVMAKLELAKSTGVQDLLLTDFDGNIVECTSSNFFYKKGNVWYTPDLECSGVVGVMRSFILEYMQQHDISCECVTESLSCVDEIDEAFICNALTGIVVVSSITFGNVKNTLGVVTGSELRTAISKELESQL